MKLAVIFPGVGYTVDKPLLYYPKKYLKQSGYDIIDISYEGIEFGDISKWAENEKAISAYLDSKIPLIEQQILKYDLTKYTEIVFICKSVGTVFGIKYAKKHNIPAKFILATPLPMALDFDEKICAIAFCGGSDWLVNFASIEEKCKNTCIKTIKIPNANHSLETGNVILDIKTLENYMKEVIELCETD